MLCWPITCVTSHLLSHFLFTFVARHPVQSCFSTYLHIPLWLSQISRRCKRDVSVLFHYTSDGRPHFVCVLLLQSQVKNKRRKTIHTHHCLLAYLWFVVNKRNAMLVGGEGKIFVWKTTTNPSSRYSRKAAFCTYKPCQERVSALLQSWDKNKTHSSKYVDRFSATRSCNVQLSDNNFNTEVRKKELLTRYAIPFSVIEEWYLLQTLHLS